MRDVKTTLIINNAPFSHKHSLQSVQSCPQHHDRGVRKSADTENYEKNRQYFKERDKKMTLDRRKCALIFGDRGELQRF